MTEQEKEKRKQEFNNDMQTMDANEFLKKYNFSNNEIILAYCLDPSKKALFNNIKKVLDCNGNLLLQKYEINDKWYWGLPEEEK